MAVSYRAIGTAYGTGEVVQYGLRYGSSFYHVFSTYVPFSYVRTIIQPVPTYRTLLYATEWYVYAGRQYGTSAGCQSLFRSGRTGLLHILSLSGQNKNYDDF